jgi:hypothetical protein
VGDGRGDDRVKFGARKAGSDQWGHVEIQALPLSPRPASQDSSKDGYDQSNTKFPRRQIGKFARKFLFVKKQSLMKSSNGREGKLASSPLWRVATLATGRVAAIAGKPGNLVFIATDCRTRKTN